MRGIQSNERQCPTPSPCRSRSSSPRSSRSACHGETVKGAETEKNRAFRSTHRAWAPKEVVDLERRMHPPRRWLETFALVFVGVLLKFPPDAQGLLIKESITLLSYFALAALAPDDATDGVALHTTLRVIALVVATAVVVVAANHTCGRGHVRSALRQHVGDRQGSEKMLDVDSDDSDDDDDVAAVITPDSADGGKGEERKSDAVADDDDSLRMSEMVLLADDASPRKSADDASARSPSDADARSPSKSRRLANYSAAVAAVAAASYAAQQAAEDRADDPVAKQVQKVLGAPRGAGMRPTFFNRDSFLRETFVSRASSEKRSSADASSAGGLFRRVIKSAREQTVFFIREMRSHLLR